MASSVVDVFKRTKSKNFDKDSEKGERESVVCDNEIKDN